MVILKNISVFGCKQVCYVVNKFLHTLNFDISDNSTVLP